MTYQDTLDWMFAQLPMYQRQGQSAYRKDLTNTLKLADHLNHPEEKFKSIHVAGTNGKGSTSHMLASILQEAGYKIGLYTSPHLKDFRERIKINGHCITEEFVIDFIKTNRSFFEENQLSFFEMTVGMAFNYFVMEKVDLGVIEVGMGGRLDSTNIIKPEVSVITNIGLDHTQFLGESLGEIAKEKAGIIKENIPVVIGETQRETKPVFLDVARKNDAEIIFADELISTEYKSDLQGSYQEKNIKTVVQTVYELQKLGYDISEANIEKGFKNVVANTGLLGRWQELGHNPKIICDTGHNREGLAYVMKQLKQEEYKKLHIVFGVVSDKNIEGIVDLLPKEATYYYCKPDIARGMKANVLKSTLDDYGIKGSVYSSVNEAYKAARQNADVADLIFVGGSTFVVAEII